jgi:hypothetical protein
MASSRTPAGGLPDDTYRQSLDNGDQMVLSTLRLRSRSLFCLEPVGLNPGRKSQIDAILSGCIPVLVFPRQVYVSASSRITSVGESTRACILSRTTFCKGVSICARNSSASMRAGPRAPCSGPSRATRAPSFTALTGPCLAMRSTPSSARSPMRSTSRLALLVPARTRYSRGAARMRHCLYTAPPLPRTIRRMTCKGAGCSRDCRRRWRRGGKCERSSWGGGAGRAGVGPAIGMIRIGLRRKFT